jgi:ATP-dependent helicase HrpA
VTALDFEPASIEPHLHMNLRLRDEQGKVLATSRDLDALRAKFGGRAGDAFAARAGREMAADGLRTFPAAPIPLQVPGEAGVPAYPALLDEGDSVALRIFADRQQAQEAHPLGVRRLLEIALAEKVKQARKQLPVGAKTGLLYAAIESQERLRGDLVDAAMNAVLAEGLEDIRDAAAFEQRREHAAKALFGEAMSRLKLAESILALVAELKPMLEAPLMGWARGNLDDMEAQLAGLIHPGFLRDTPADALAQYPRYLKAMILRTERAKRDPPRDQARMLELHPFLEALEAGEQQGLRDRPQWQALRWDLEELRVSLFAQELGAHRHFGEEAGAAGDRTSPGVNARHGRPIGRPWPPGMDPARRCPALLGAANLRLHVHAVHLHVPGAHHAWAHADVRRFLAATE